MAGAFAPAVVFIALIAAFALVAQHFGVTIELHTAISVVFLLGPYWFFGFGLDRWLRNRNVTHTLTPLILITAWLVYAIPAHQFRWTICLGMSGLIAIASLLLKRANAVSPATPDWHDLVVLAMFGISVEFRFFDRAWPIAGLSGLPKLLFLDAVLYGYLVLRPIGGIGFNWRAKLSDLGIGLREFLLYSPIALALGFVLQFLHLHRTAGTPVAFAAGWLFTLFFVAMPEELFFRGLMLNMLERRLGTSRALILTSVIFGLAHFNKRAQYFNWRYVILAAIAGLFYGRAWLARRRLLASSITHATVDTVWSIWLR
jgi:membrane protease YdiL (CAAX protease family)